MIKDITLIYALYIIKHELTEHKQTDWMSEFK